MTGREIKYFFFFSFVESHISISNVIYSNTEVNGAFETLRKSLSLCVSTSYIAEASSFTAKTIIQYL